MSDPLPRLKAALADRYAVERELGSGGMATVYLAEDLKLNRKVAVKVLRPELAAILGAERFLKEIEVTANLQHPGILPLHDSGESDSFLYYVMPYVEGESLRQRLDREKQLGVDETVEIAKAVAAALDYAHRHGVIHRDIKPENIMLQDGQALVADFGIALAVSQAGGTRLTETGLSLGTPHYMSPEQATGDRDLDARSDVYSLGCVAYEMLAGEPPHVGHSAQTIIARILSEKPSPISQTRDLVPANVDAAVQRALAKTPADRFVSAAQFAEALTNPAFRLQTSEEIGAREQATWNRLSRGLAATLVVVGAVAVWGLRPRTEAPQPVIRYRMAVPVSEGLGTPIGLNLDLSPDGTHLVYAAALDGPAQLWLRDRSQLVARPLGGTEGALQPFFSPDGRSVGFITSDRRLRVVSLGSEQAVTLVDSSFARGGGAWGEDGFVYFVVGHVNASPGLGRIPASGGVMEPVTTLDSTRGEVIHHSPDALPGGRGVVFTVWRGMYNADLAEIAVADIKSGTHKVLMPGVFARWTPRGLLVVRADGSLVHVPFDVNTLQITGPTTPLVEGIAVSQATVDLAVSETGTLVYAPGGTSSARDEMVWVTRDGTAALMDPGWAGDFREIELSPDGNRLAVSVSDSTGEQIWIKQLDRGPLTKLTFEGTMNHRPAWTPDGRSITFTTTRGENQDLYMIRADGSAPAQLLLDDERPVVAVAHTSDLAWMAVQWGDASIYAVRSDGGGLSASSTIGPVQGRFLALSPDGLLLVYVSAESGRAEVYVRPFPNMGDWRRQISPSGGSNPKWAPSGQELFYVNAAEELVAVDIGADEGFAIGERRVLFSVAGYNMAFDRYDVEPGDQRFVMHRARSVDELIVVENFFEELKAKVGN